MSGEGKQKEGASAFVVTLMQDAMFFVGGVMALCTFTGGMALAGIFLGWAFDGKEMLDKYQSVWSLDIVILYLIYGMLVVGAVRSLKMVHVIFPDGAHLPTVFAWIRSAIGLVLFIVCVRYYWAGLGKAHNIWHQIAFWMGGLIFWFGYGATDVGEDWARFFLKLAPRPKAGGHGHAHWAMFRTRQQKFPEKSGIFICLISKSRFLIRFYSFQRRLSTKLSLLSFESQLKETGEPNALILYTARREAVRTGSSSPWTLATR